MSSSRSSSVQKMMWLSWGCMIFFVCVWFQLQKILQNLSICRDNFSSAQIHNFLSLYHNVVSVIYILLYLWNPWKDYIETLMIWSISYYIFDMTNYENRKDRMLMICHHIGSIVVELYLHILYLDPDDANGRAVLMGLLFAEISNYPLYIIHHLKSAPRKSEDETTLSYDKISQWWYIANALSFGLLRGPVGFYYLFVAPVPMISLRCFIFIFWMMSFYWVYLMLKKIICLNREKK